MKISYFGTTTLLFDDGTDQIMFDAYITRPSMVQAFFSGVSTDTDMADEILREYHIDRLKGIFVSHSHMDHVLDAPYFANKTGAVIYGSVSTMNVGRGGAVPEEQLVQFEADKTYQIGAFRIRVIPSIHSKAHFYNDDLGQVIEKPVQQPGRMKDYKEGGSFDFYIEHGEDRYLIRPSYNYIVGQLDGIRADVLFLGIAGISKAGAEEQKEFFQETAEKVGAKLIIPVHWDNFFRSLRKEPAGMPKVAENTSKSLQCLAEYCRKNDRQMIVQMPRSFIEL